MFVLAKFVSKLLNLMKRNFEILHRGLSEVLQEAAKEADPVNRCLRSIQQVQEAIRKMKEMVLADPFPGKEAEIHHFKNEAPEIYSHYFYFMELCRIVTKRAYTEPLEFENILRQEMQGLVDFFNSHDHICRYYYQCSTHSDEYLFTRRESGQWLGDEIGALISPDFTIGTYWISWIKANERLRRWIKTELENIEPVKDEGGNKKGRRLTWKAHKVDAVELLASLHLAGCFGKSTLKEVMEWGEETLGIKIGQYHVVLGEIAIRKIERIKFLSGLQNVLEEKLDMLVERNRR